MVANENFNLELQNEDEEFIVNFGETTVLGSGGGAVSSVNGQTGDVVLTTSDLENTSDYQTGDEVDTAIDSAITDKQDKLTAGDNITISEQNVISATDTTYSDFTGTDGTTAGEAGLVPAPATTDVDKFLKSDGTWGETGGGDTVITLTSADYNYHSSGDTDDGVAIWKLEPGLYYSYGVKIYTSTSASTTAAYSLYVCAKASDAVGIFISAPFSTKGNWQYSIYRPNTGQIVVNDSFIIASQIVNSTGTSTNSVMSQNATTNALDAMSISGSGAPTASTTGAVGQLYRDTTNGDLYICTAVSGSTYTWEEVGASGGGMVELTTADYNWNSTTGTTGTPNCVALWLLPGGLYKGPAGTSIDVRATATKSYSMGSGFSSYAVVKPYDSLNNRANVTFIDNSDGSITQYYSIAEDGGSFSTRVIPKTVQTTGTSTTDVMSQNAVTSMVFADPSTKRKVQIGYASSASSPNGIAIGYSASVSSRAQETIAIGSGSHVDSTHTGSIALGAYSGNNITAAGMMDIGSAFGSYGYNSTNYRLLTGLYDGQSAHDAVTVGQINATIDAINTALSTSIPHIGATT